MPLNGRLNAYLTDPAGAADVDWTMISAALLLLGIATVYALFGAGVYELTGVIGGNFQDALFAEHNLDSPRRVTGGT